MPQVTNFCLQTTGKCTSVQSMWLNIGLILSLPAHRPRSTVKKKMATGTITFNALRTQALKERMKPQRNIVSHSNLTRAMLLV